MRGTGVVRSGIRRAARVLAAIGVVGALAMPIPASAQSAIAAIEMGSGQSCALLDPGTVECWGNGFHGRLGDGTTTSRTTAARVTVSGGGDLTNATQLSVGNDLGCVRRGDGTAWCWGGNGRGELGDGTTTDRTRAVQVLRSGGGVLTDVVGVAAGLFVSCAWRTDGSAWCWGENSRGEVGDGTTKDRTKARQVVKANGTPLTGVVEMSTGGPFACARTSGGAAWCWGENDTGRLGDGTTIDRSHAVRVKQVGGTLLGGVTGIAAGALHACARLDDGSAWCWGQNAYGEVGDGTKTMRTLAVRVTKPGILPSVPVALSGVTAIAAGSGQSCAVVDDLTAWCWGSNDRGQVGDGTTIDRTRARQVRTPTIPLAFVLSISTGQQAACALQANGDAACWGGNDDGALGDGSTHEHHYATTVTVVP